MKKNKVTLLSAVVGMLAGILICSAEDPGWWSQRNVVNGNATHPAAAANVGQLQRMALAAEAEMNEKLPEGAGPDVAAAVSDVVALEPSLRALPIGLLKDAARPFYTRFDDLTTAYPGVSLCLPSGVTDIYPWTEDDTTDDEDNALANIAQLKQVFGFDFDGDNDGMPDWWEVQYGLNTQLDDSNVDNDYPSIGMPAFRLSFDYLDEVDGIVRSQGRLPIEGQVSGAGFNTDGKFNSAFSFNGSTDKIEFPGSEVFNLTDFTIAAWVRSADFTTGIQVIFDGSSSDTSQGGVGLALVQNKMQVFIRHADGSESFFPVKNDFFTAEDNGVWHHVAATFSYGEIESVGKLYLDGDLVHEETSANMMPLHYGGQCVTVGNAGFQAYGFNGDLDELVIYDRVLDENEIASLRDLDQPDGLSNYLEYKLGCSPSDASDDHGGLGGFLMGANESLSFPRAKVFEATEAASEDALTGEEEDVEQPVIYMGLNNWLNLPTKQPCRDGSYIECIEYRTWKATREKYTGYPAFCRTSLPGEATLAPPKYYCSFDEGRTEKGWTRDDGSTRYNNDDPYTYSKHVSIDAEKMELLGYTEDMDKKTMASTEAPESFDIPVRKEIYRVRVEGAARNCRVKTTWELDKRGHEIGETGVYEWRDCTRREKDEDGNDVVVKNEGNPKLGRCYAGGSYGITGLISKYAGNSIFGDAEETSFRGDGHASTVYGLEAGVDVDVELTLGNEYTTEMLKEYTHNDLTRVRDFYSDWESDHVWNKVGHIDVPGTLFWRSFSGESSTPHNQITTNDYALGSLASLRKQVVEIDKDPGDPLKYEVNYRLQVPEFRFKIANTVEGQKYALRWYEQYDASSLVEFDEGEYGFENKPAKVGVVSFVGVGGDMYVGKGLLVEADKDDDAAADVDEDDYEINEELSGLENYKIALEHHGYSLAWSAGRQEHGIHFMELNDDDVDEDGIVDLNDSYVFKEVDDAPDLKGSFVPLALTIPETAFSKMNEEAKVLLFDESDKSCVKIWKKDACEQRTDEDEIALVDVEYGLSLAELGFSRGDLGASEHALTKTFYIEGVKSGRGAIILRVDPDGQEGGVDPVNLARAEYAVVNVDLVAKELSIDNAGSARWKEVPEADEESPGVNLLPVAGEVFKLDLSLEPCMADRYSNIVLSGRDKFYSDEECEPEDEIVNGIIENPYEQSVVYFKSSVNENFSITARHIVSGVEDVVGFMAPRLNVSKVMSAKYLPGAEWNFLPGGDGAGNTRQNREPVLIFGSRSDGCIHLKCDVDGLDDLSSVEKGKLLFRLAKLNRRDPENLAKVKIRKKTVSTLFSPGELCRIKIEPYWACMQQDRHVVVAGLDDDGDGELGINEVVGWGIYPIVLVDNAMHAYAVVQGHKIMLGAQCLGPIPKLFYSTFMSSNPPSGSKSVSSSDCRLQHPVGLEFNVGGCDDTVNEFVFPSSSDASLQISVYSRLRKRLGDMMHAKRKFINEYFKENEYSETYVGAEMLNEKLHFGEEDLDLWISLGTSDLSIVCDYRVSRSPREITYFSIRGSVTDLFDWEFKMGDDDCYMCTVSAGYPTMSRRGKVFLSEFSLDHELPYMKGQDMSCLTMVEGGE